jgi:hypothetical protein
MKKIIFFAIYCFILNMNGQSNLLSDSSFEQSLQAFNHAAKWSTINSRGFVLNDGVNAYEGNGYLKTDKTGAVQTPVAIKANTDYTFRFFAKGTGILRTGFRTLNIVREVNADMAVTANYTQYTVVINTKNTTSTIGQLFFYTAGSGTLYIDSITVEEGNTTSNATATNDLLNGVGSVDTATKIWKELNGTSKIEENPSEANTGNAVGKIVKGTIAQDNITIEANQDYTVKFYARATEASENVIMGLTSITSDVLYQQQLSTSKSYYEILFNTGNPTDLKGLFLVQNRTADGTIYVDDIVLEKGNTLTTTPTAIPIVYPAATEIDNGVVKATFQENALGINQSFYAKNESGNWALVSESFIPKALITEDDPTLYDDTTAPGYQFMVNSNVNNIQKINNTSVRLTGIKQGVPITQEITIPAGSQRVHFDVSLQLKEPKLDKTVSAFTFNHQGAPSFVQTPTLKFDNEDSNQNRWTLVPSKDQVIGDRAYHSPAIVLQEGKLFTALVPDLNSINENKMVSPDARRTSNINRNRFSVAIENDKWTMPTGLDLNVVSGISDNKPLFAYGYMDNIIQHHIRYQRRNDGSMIRSLDKTSVKYGFDLFLGANEKENVAFQKVIQFMWQAYGKEIFDNRIHLAMPMNEYFKLIDNLTFNPNSEDEPIPGYEDTGSWLQWDEQVDGKTVKYGGYRGAASLFNTYINNTAFWSNARETQGFWFWGERMNRPDVKERAERIINLIISAPQNEFGLFDLRFNAADKTWQPSWTDPVNGRFRFFLKSSNSYDVSTMSKTGAHLVDFYLRCNKDQRILDFFTPYADWLLTVIDSRGAVPSYVDDRNMQSSSVLYYSAQPVASMWFLSEMYRATNETKYLNGAKEISKYIENEIIPTGKWIDNEQYASGGHKPLAFQKDIQQAQWARGNLCIYWAGEGYASLYKATQDEKYLKLGEQTIDFVSFTQCGWEPHYIYTAFPFGGFTVDNSDTATYLDARQCEMVRNYIWYGKELGRQDLLERGVAAGRSSSVLIHHPKHISNNIYRLPNIYPVGFGPENIDHEANPQSALRTHPSWGEGSGIFTCLAELLRGTGGLYVNAEKNLAVGVDGVKVTNFKVENGTVTLALESIFTDITDPWTSIYKTGIVLDGLDDNTSYDLVFNGAYSGSYTSNELNLLRFNIGADGTITIDQSQLSTQVFIKDKGINVYFENGFLYIKTSETNNAIKHVDLYDLSGRKVYSKTSRENKYNLNFLKTGIYIVKIKSSDNIDFSSKLIKTR